MSNGKDNLEVGLKAFSELLDEFRRGNIANKKVVRQSLEQHLMDYTTKPSNVTIISKSSFNRNRRNFNDGAALKSQKNLYNPTTTKSPNSV